MVTENSQEETLHSRDLKRSKTEVLPPQTDEIPREEVQELSSLMRQTIGEEDRRDLVLIHPDVPNRFWNVAMRLPLNPSYKISDVVPNLRRQEDVLLVQIDEVVADEPGRSFQLEIPHFSEGGSDIKAIVRAGKVLRVRSNRPLLEKDRPILSVLKHCLINADQYTDPNGEMGTKLVRELRHGAGEIDPGIRAQTPDVDMDIFLARSGFDN